MENPETSDLEKVTIKNHYSKIAQRIALDEADSCCTSSCCEDTEIDSKIELKNLTEDKEQCCETTCCDTSQSIREKSDVPSLGSDLSLLLFAKPKQGDIVVDFGSGPGHDVLEVAEIIGPSGKAIGVDFSDDMIDLAERNSRDRAIENVEFVKSELTDINLENNTADLVVSNCVFNLVGNRMNAFKEAYRILKPGGRLTISDYITHIDDSEQLDIKSKCGCIGGATSIDEYLDIMKKVGFENVSYEIEYNDEVKLNGQDVKYSSVLFFGEKKIN